MKRTVKGKRGGAWSPSRKSRKKRDCQCAMIKDSRGRLQSMICGKLSRKWMRKASFRTGIKITFTKCSPEDAAIAARSSHSGQIKLAK